jgi:hypothetical protein
VNVCGCVYGCGYVYVCGCGYGYGCGEEDRGSGEFYVIVGVGVYGCGSVCIGAHQLVLLYVILS